jgi:hypothetical protein
VIAAYGFSRTTIYKWLKASSGRGKGLKPIFYSLQVPPLAKLLILLAADACAWIL